MSTIGERLKDERKRLGLNQRELADIAGVSRNTQINYEKGRRLGSDYLVEISKVGADIQYIITSVRSINRGNQVHDDQGGHDKTQEVGALSREHEVWLEIVRALHPKDRVRLREIGLSLAYATSLKNKK